MLAFIRRLLDSFAERDRGTAENVLPRVSGQELDRLVGVALTVISQEARGSQPPPKPQE
jgi:hypothetical protein